MTGIERLRELAKKHRIIGHYLTADTIDGIADQIEREHVSRIRVLAVITEMERLLHGNEVMGNSPVARWARELRRALKSDTSDAADTQNPSCADAAETAGVISEAQKVTREDVDAIAWVREHGGLELVKNLLNWVIGHCSTKQQLDFDFWLSGRVMYELGFDEDTADRDEVERRLLARLMPEGMEWPRFESGEPVRIGDEVTVTVHDEDGDFDRTLAIRSIKYKEDGVLLEGTKNEMVIICHSERVRRPAPKALDADGVEIRVGDHVWNEVGTAFTAIAVDGKNKSFKAMRHFDGQECEGLNPAIFTHRAPVLAADGRPLREGETVYDIEDEKGYPHTVTSTDLDGLEHVKTTCEEPTPASVSIHPSRLTHERLVLDEDGVPIKVGETVWHEDGTELRVLEFKHEEDGERIVSVKFMDGPTNWSEVRSLSLTHERPDSWDRLEEDVAGASCPDVYCANHHIDASDTSYEWAMARDIVRRCRALAEREMGEA